MISDTSEYKRAWYKKHRDRIRTQHREMAASDPDYTKRRHAAYARNIVSHILAMARKRAKEHGVPFSIGKDDIIIPYACPVLSIPLIIGTSRGPTDNSPSLDRIIPSLGYVRGNVIVVSSLANRIKSNASVDQIVSVGEFYRRILNQGEVA